MSKKKTTLKVLISDPDIERRVRVREALREVAKIENYDARSLSEIQFLLNEVGSFDLFVLSSAFGDEDIRRLISTLAQGPASRHVPVVILLRPEARVAPFVAEMYARGVLGFICEPFSVSDVTEILSLIDDNKAGRLDQKRKDRLATSFLLADALKHFDKVVELRLDGKKSLGYAGRDFKDDCSAMRDTAANLSESELSSILEKRFAKAEPRQLTEAEKKKKVKKRPAPAMHPGEELRILMSSRGISREKFLSIAKIPEAELDQIVASKEPITEETSEKIARAIGRSAQYWLALQKKYDDYQAFLEEEKQNGLS